jgi:rubrerythrin
MARAPASAPSGLQFIAEQVAELYGTEQIVLRAEQDLASRTNDADFRSHLEKFVAEDQQHIENLRQILRMMLGSESSVQSSIDRGRHFAEAVLAASQETAYRFIRGLLLLMFETAMDGRIFMQIQQCVENREIIGLLETNHHQDENHLRYLESQVIRAAEELSGLFPR